MPDCRQLCIELINELNGYKVAHPQHDTELIDRARAALRAVAAAHCEAVEIRTGSGTGEIDVIVRESRILDIAAELEAQ